MIHRPTLISHMMQTIASTQVLNDTDLKWCDLIINRNDGQDGVEQLAVLVEMCHVYNTAKANFSPWEDYVKQKEIAARLFAVKSLYYKQKRILLACPQRRKHKNVDIPNLKGLIAAQKLRIDPATCYGLGYAESRQFFVNKALTENIYTHIMFLDDDILLPLEAITRLIDAEADIIGCNYVKKNPLLESTATTLSSDPKLIWQQSSVEPVQNDYRIIDVNCLGLGATLVDVDVFRKIPMPHFEFVYEHDANGNRTRLLVGEDSRMSQKAMMCGIIPKIIPGLVPLHVDFRNGKHFGPTWLVDPATNKVRPEFKDRYCEMAVDNLQELVAPDNDDVFSFSNPK